MIARCLVAVMWLLLVGCAAKKPVKSKFHWSCSITAIDAKSRPSMMNCTDPDGTVQRWRVVEEKGK
jgi:hypothetical protein